MFRATATLVPIAVLSLALGTAACSDDAAGPGGSDDVPGRQESDEGVETTVPVGTDPQMTPAPNPNAGGGAPAPSG